MAGTERAVAAAVAALGSEEVAGLLPYLQQAAFGMGLRRAIKAAGIDVDDLREAAAGATEAEKPELAKLRRVTWGTLLQLGLLVLAAYAVLSFFSGVDFGDLQDDLRDASWPWLIAGGHRRPAPRVTQAVSTRGAIPAQLPFGPVYVMQLAMSYMNLALPSSFARMAVSVRFFQRQGVPPAAAITSGTIDSFTNTVVQAVLLVLLLLFSSASLNLDISAPDASGVIRIAVLLVAVAAAFMVAVARVSGGPAPGSGRGRPLVAAGARHVAAPARLAPARAARARQPRRRAAVRRGAGLFARAARLSGRPR